MADDKSAGHGLTGSTSPAAAADEASTAADSSHAGADRASTAADRASTEAGPAGVAGPGQGAADTPAGGPARPAGRSARWTGRGLRAPAGLWLSVFVVSFGLFIIRFLVPSPVAQADNRDGPRLTCGLGLHPITNGHPRFFRFSYFEYVPLSSCAHRLPYPSSELVPLELGRLLTPVLGLPGTLNFIAVGLLICAVASAGIASFATGLRLRLWARLLIAAIIWLIMADAAFFDVYAGPFSEASALVGLLLVAAGVLYLGRGWHASVFGLVLAGTGGFFAILSKEQYLILAVPICITLVLAGADRDARGLRRFRSRQANAAVAVAVILAILAGGYATWDATSRYGQRLHHIQAVDMIFTSIVTTRADAPAGLRALGLPASWAKYAGRYYWHPDSVRDSPLFARYETKLTDSNIAHYLLTHPASIVSIGQRAAVQAQLFRVTTLGDYPPDAGHKKGAMESRVAVFTWLAHQLPPSLGLLWYVPLWAVMAVLAIFALRRGRRAWHRDAAVLVLCMTGCAIVGFIPQAYFAGVSVTRHMVGTNMTTAIALTVSVALAASMILQGAARARRRPETTAAPPVPAPAR